MVVVPNGMLASQLSVMTGRLSDALACWPARAMAAATAKPNRTFELLPTLPLRIFLYILSSYSLLFFLFCIYCADCFRHPNATAAGFIAAPNLCPAAKFRIH